MAHLVPRTLEQATAVGYGFAVHVLLVAGFAGPVRASKTATSSPGTLPCTTPAR